MKRITTYTILYFMIIVGVLAYLYFRVEDGIYSNILLYVYDADACEFYAYKWDS